MAIKKKEEKEEEEGKNVNAIDLNRIIRHVLNRNQNETHPSNRVYLVGHR